MATAAKTGSRSRTLVSDADFEAVEVHSKPTDLDAAG
jgi:hypothetical protein